jgi:hypothetical protein
MESRLLLGFSKSGRGAFSLLLRNPDTFYRAAGWDSGVQIDMGPIDEETRVNRIKEMWGSEDDFERHRISTLVRTRGKELGEKSHLFHYNTEGTRAIAGQHLHQVMVEEKFPHRYFFEPIRPHRWDSGWIPMAFEFLVEE